ncbi:hypothetical protein JTE90_020032 [Oedothorax gibbosus]|uniref:Solute carrier organic anion transporter family member n=1 Tax=Oedothorax gibbosus TaxID=931172 RepID=A0AAV6USH0_9ARAC|nr:hypothetical protein JTE90_020032 [Oedothorax gibbosus]
MLKGEAIKSSDNEEISDAAELRKISYEVVSEVLKKAGRHLNDIAHKPQNLSPNTSVPYNSARRKDDVNSDSNAEVENDAKPNEVNDKGKVIQFKEVLKDVYDSEDFTKKIEIEMRKSNLKYDVDPDTICGIGCFKPKWLQAWATPRGFGNLAYYAVGLAYMDDNSKQKNTPMYLAVAFALRLLGPLLGFLMSSVFLKFPENPFVDPGFGNEDPRWIGGWWMGFLLQGFLLALCTVPMAMFPRRLPGHKQPKLNIMLPDKKELRSKVLNFFAAMKRLMKNPLLIFITLNVIFSTLGTFGHYIMLPKYMENQFKLSASEASLASGPPGIAASVTSILLGGFTIYRLRPSAKVLTAAMVSLEVVTAIGFLMLKIPHCEVTEMANYGLDDNGLVLSSDCNDNCSCSTSKFTPVCSLEGNTFYFSPCYAGCKITSNQEFEDCSCVQDKSGLNRKNVTEGFCVSKDCWPQALMYIISFPILQCVVSFLKAAYTMLLLRSIDPQDKSVALGIFETMISAFGFIPFPMVFGSLVDSACLVWETTCGKTGNCWFYDVSKFNYLLHGASALFSALSAACLFVVFLLSARLRNLYEEDIKEGIDTKLPETEEGGELNMVTKF